MASTTYRHLGNVTGMFSAQEQFRHVTKMVCARFRGFTIAYQFAVIGNLVRNA